MVSGLVALNNAGEGRLLEAALGGKVPLGVAMDIARTSDEATQRELLKAYESKQLNHLSIRVVKRLMERRRLLGKQPGNGVRGLKKVRASAESMVNAYRRESQKQKVMVRKARICEAKLLFIVSAFSRLVADENFATLLRAEGLATMPKTLWDKVSQQRKEAA